MNARRKNTEARAEARHDQTVETGDEDQTLKAGRENCMFQRRYDVINGWLLITIWDEETEPCV